MSYYDDRRILTTGTTNVTPQIISRIGALIAVVAITVIAFLILRNNYLTPATLRLAFILSAMSFRIEIVSGCVGSLDIVVYYITSISTDGICDVKNVPIV